MTGSHRELIEEIEATPDYEENTLKQMKKNAWSILCGYTHGGYYHVAHRNTPTEINSDYNEDYITGLINQTSSITLLTMAAIASLTSNEEFANNALSQYDTIFNVQQA